MYSRRDFLKRLCLAAPALAWMTPAWARESDPAPRTVDLDFLSDEMEVVRRRYWTQVAPRPWRLRPACGFSRITVHHNGSKANYHTAKSTVIRDLDGVLTSHLDRNYGDIGYHFVLDYAGRVWEGRSLAFEGAHVSRENEHNIGIMLQGNFEMQKPSEIQAFALKRLVSLLRKRFVISRDLVYGHRDIGASVCPGQYLYRHVVTIRRLNAIG